MPAEWVSMMPALNASLNALAAMLLVLAYGLIRRGRREAHRTVMLMAFGVSGLFLISYVIYHSQHGSTPFPHQGPIRAVYFTILVTHIVLAAAILPMAIVTLRLGLRGQFARHRRLARWTLPIWLYVSVTGVLIYWMLYRLQW
jgi:uncharacterized membrane protein YozB (DUF420 family)